MIQRTEHKPILENPYLPEKIKETKLTFLDFYDVDKNGDKVEGKKLRVTRIYENGSQKTHLCGICKKKKGVWKFISLTSEGKMLLEEKGFDASLKEMSAKEKELVTKLKGEWELPVSASKNNKAS